MILMAVVIKSNYDEPPESKYNEEKDYYVSILLQLCVILKNINKDFIWKNDNSYKNELKSTRSNQNTYSKQNYDTYNSYETKSKSTKTSHRKFSDSGEFCLTNMFPHYI